MTDPNSSPEMPQLRCSSCERMKDIVFFHRDPAKKGGRRSKCISCVSEQKKESTRMNFTRSMIPYNACIPN